MNRSIDERAARRGALAVGCVLALGALGFAGCDGDEFLDDAGPRVDAGPMTEPDAGPGPTDAGPPPDAGGGDAGLDCASSGCDTGQTCLRGVCVAHCGADPSGWDAALAARLTPVASFCRSADVIDSAASADLTTVFEMVVTPGGASSMLALSSWDVDPAMAPAPTSIGSLIVTHADPLFPGGYIAASPSRDAVLIGYTVSDAGFTGEVFRVMTSDGGELAIAADGNFDAAWVDDTVFLVNGTGLGAASEGQGLYAGTVGTAITGAQVATGLGDASGSVAVGPDYVLAGGFFFGDGSNRVYAIARSEVEDVIAGSRAVIDLATEGAEVCPSCALQSAFVLAGGALVVKRFDAMFAQTGLLAFQLTGFDPSSGLSVGAEETLVEGDAFTEALAADGGRVLLRFGEGLLLVE